MDMTKPNDVDTASVQSIVLLPCPFCGSDDVGVSYDDYDFARWVSCNQCECDGALLQVQPGTKEAALAGVVRKWNQRSGVEWNELSEDMKQMLLFYNKHPEQHYFHDDLLTKQIFEALKKLGLLESVGSPSLRLAKITQRGIDYCESLVTIEI